MKYYNSLIKILRPTDILVIVFYSILTIINIVFWNKIDNALTHILLNVLLILSIITLAWFVNKTKIIVLQQIHFWYIVPLIFATFKELHFMVEPMRGVIYDDILIKADRLIFGFDPTVELFKIANPFLTELLQIVYATFFFLPIILGVDLMIRNKDRQFCYMTFIIVLGFFLSYIGYIIFPAIGPRFTLHDFDLTNIELPGIFLTNYLREIVNAGESIPAGTLNPAQVVQRDAFPSGHTQMTLLVMYLSFKFNSGTKYFFLINGSLLIFATVYLRYHYVVDLIGGTVFMIITLWGGLFLYNFIMKLQGKERFDYPK
ncbi:MAG: phosphatase PAP2 family protein [Bacteroidetes bacterium]|nr:phosphatase PAP2 family protein [Bacteroidota bacterium]